VTDARVEQVPADRLTATISACDAILLAVGRLRSSEF
jgi:hypothetical protein